MAINCSKSDSHCAPQSSARQMCFPQPAEIQESSGSRRWKARLFESGALATANDQSFKTLGTSHVTWMIEVIGS